VLLGVAPPPPSASWGGPRPSCDKAWSPIGFLFFSALIEVPPGVTGNSKYSASSVCFRRWFWRSVVQYVSLHETRMAEALSRLSCESVWLPVATLVVVSSKTRIGTTTLSFSLQTSHSAAWLTSCSHTSKKSKWSAPKPVLLYLLTVQEALFSRYFQSIPSGYMEATCA
jgi:hypothetical protein